MAECREAKLTDDLYDLHIEVDLSDWTNDQDAYSLQKRSEIIHRVIVNHQQYSLRRILQSGWDVNERLTVFPRTALNTAAHGGWTEGVKMLLDAGAKCEMSDKNENPLTLAMNSSKNLTDDVLIELLLKHGADPNNHNDKFDNIPLLYAIENCRSNKKSLRIVRLLLEHGANPHVCGKKSGLACENVEWPLHAVLRSVFRSYDVFAALFTTLVHFGADPNYYVDRGQPLLHSIMFERSGYHCNRLNQQHLDLFFLHGGNINLEYGDDKRTVLVNAVRCGFQSNGIRWLLRHGADAEPVEATLLKDYMYPLCDRRFFPGPTLVLLNAGIGVSKWAQTWLSNMATAISDSLQSTIPRDINELIITDVTLSDQSEKIRLQKTHYTSRKSTNPRYCALQMADLQGFSDESLHFYPEEEIWVSGGLGLLNQINRILQFLSQPQSLQWYCRRCVRENLVSLQPSVVKTLPIPARLKRYILCHDI